MTKILFHYTVETDGENLRIKSEIGGNLTPAETLVVGIFRWHAKKAERTLLAVARNEDGIILA